MLNSNFGEKKIAALQHHSCPLVIAEPAPIQVIPLNELSFAKKDRRGMNTAMLRCSGTNRRAAKGTKICFKCCHYCRLPRHEAEPALTCGALPLSRPSIVGRAPYRLFQPVEAFKSLFNRPGAGLEE